MGCFRFFDVRIWFAPSIGSPCPVRELVPWINDRDMRFVVIAAVTCDDCKPVVYGRRSYEEVRLRERVSRFPAFLNQKSPLKDDVFGDLENPEVKHGTHLI